jgi:hypothetical protein
MKPATNPLGASASEVVRAAFLLGHVCGSLEDLPEEIADQVAYRCLRTIVLQGRLTRGRHLRLCWSANLGERQAVQELARLESELDTLPRTLRVWRETRYLGARPHALAVAGATGSATGSATGIATGGAPRDAIDTDVSAGWHRPAKGLSRHGRWDGEVRGLYHELKAVLGGRAVVPVPD